jgi:hypothetical protein
MANSRVEATQISACDRTLISRRAKSPRLCEPCSCFALQTSPFHVSSRLGYSAKARLFLCDRLFRVDHCGCRGRLDPRFISSLSVAGDLNFHVGKWIKSLKQALGKKNLFSERSQSNLARRTFRSCFAKRQKHWHKSGIIFERIRFRLVWFPIW